MHEMAVTESILKIVLNHAEMNKAEKVITIYLQIGGLSDLEGEWLQRYFDYLSKGTIAGGAKLKIERTPVMVKCGTCPGAYEVRPEQTGNLACPDCGGNNGTLLSGREYTVKTMEVQ
ncbi:MAG: hydrogenase maturation nickel metallochaperone HypA [Dethiobacter sp.]|jgi:hydrogenase nickel incorporation protein HypA/HybF|nr:hydrogenase maturation nickel metallochaperone HypA [Dethiobacter sp.]